MPALVDSAYINVETVAKLIRAISNDMIFSQAGEILTDTANVLFPLLNDALEWFENEVNNHGINTFTKEQWLLNVLAAGSIDPGIQTNISDTGYFNGVGNYPTPQLPTDLLEPLFMWERQTGSTEDWVPMLQRLDGLPSSVQSLRIRLWEWREDGIWMLGASQDNDLRLRYMGSHASLATVNDTIYFRGATGPLSYKMVSVWLLTKNPAASQAAAAEAMMRVSQLATRNARMKQRDTVTRKSYGQPRGARRFVPPVNL